MSDPKPQQEMGTSHKRHAGDYKFGARIGEGSYSSVYSAQDIHTNRTFAIKVLSKRHIVKEDKIKYVNIEKTTLHRLGQQHPGVVQLYCTFQDEASLYFVLDFAEYGELLSIIRKFGSLSESVSKFYMAQLVDSIAFIHSKGIVHRDLKPENILVGSDLNIKITDFGAAKLLPYENSNGEVNELSGSSRKGSFVGTAEYVPPELLKHNACGFESDIWALACILYQFFHGNPPFKGSTEYLTFEKIIKIDFKYQVALPKEVSQIIDDILVEDPTRRPTLEQLKAYPWFRDVKWDRAFIWGRKVPRLEGYREAQQPFVPTLKNGSNRHNNKNNSYQQLQKDISRGEIVVPMVNKRSGANIPKTPESPSRMPTQRSPNMVMPGQSLNYYQYNPSMPPIQAGKSIPDQVSAQNSGQIPHSYQSQQVSGQKLQHATGPVNRVMPPVAGTAGGSKPPAPHQVPGGHVYKALNGGLPMSYQPSQQLASTTNQGQAPSNGNYQIKKSYSQKIISPTKGDSNTSTPPQLSSTFGSSPDLINRPPQSNPALAAASKSVKSQGQQSNSSPTSPSAPPMQASVTRSLSKSMNSPKISETSKFKSESPKMSPKIGSKSKNSNSNSNGFTGRSTSGSKPISLSEISSLLGANEKILKMDIILKTQISHKDLKRKAAPLDDTTIDRLIRTHRHTLNTGCVPVICVITNQARVFFVDKELNVMRIDLKANSGADYSMYDYEFEEEEEDNTGVNRLANNTEDGYLILELIREGGDLIFLKRIQQSDSFSIKERIQVVKKNGEEIKLGQNYGWIDCLLLAKEMVSPNKKDNTTKTSSSTSTKQDKKSVKKEDKQSISKFAYAAAAAVHK